MCSVHTVAQTDTSSKGSTVKGHYSLTMLRSESSISGLHRWSRCGATWEVHGLNQGGQYRATGYKKAGAWSRGGAFAKDPPAR